jgi:hypothetical protein
LKKNNNSRKNNELTVEAWEVAGPGAAGYEGSAGRTSGKAAGKAGSEKGGSREHKSKEKSISEVNFAPISTV